MPKMSENFKKEFVDPLYYKFYLVLDNGFEIEFYKVLDPLAMTHIEEVVKNLCNQGIYIRDEFNELRKVVKFKRVSITESKEYYFG